MGDIFLNGIKYAGGVSNIFDPIIYSDTERKIGVWRDNKPLYQKTLVYTNQALSYGDTDLSLGISNMETVADSRAYITNSTHTTYRPLNSWTTASASQVFYLIEPSTGTLRVHAEGSWPSPNIYITIQYTKTTDVAGSGSYTTEGVPAHHYSTNEQVIGTWIDGKTLYETTFDLGSDKTISHTSWYNAIVSIANIENIAVCWGMYSGGTYYPLMAYHSGDNVNVLACRANSGATVRYLTLQYTKSN